MSVPVISSQPSDDIVTASGTAVFQVAASGNDITYQWYKVNTSGDDLLLQNSDSGVSIFLNGRYLILNDVTTDAQYYVVVSNAAGSVTSSVVNLFVGKIYMYATG